MAETDLGKLLDKINGLRAELGLNPRQLVAALNGFQFVYYIHLKRRGHPAAARSIKGWMRRLETVVR